MEPHLWRYRNLIEVGRGKETAWEGEAAENHTADWLGELADPVREMFAAGNRLAQEHIGWEFLAEKPGDEN